MQSFQKNKSNAVFVWIIVHDWWCSSVLQEVINLLKSHCFSFLRGCCLKKGCVGRWWSSVFWSVVDSCFLYNLLSSLLLPLFSRRFFELLLSVEIHSVLNCPTRRTDGTTTGRLLLRVIRYARYEPTKDIFL